MYSIFSQKTITKNIFIILLMGLFLVSAQNLHAQTIRYVKPTATGTGTGLSWINASGNLQAMIDASSPATSDQVWVMAGTYKPTAYPTGCTSGCATNRDYAFILKNQVKVYGGFAGTETVLTARNWTTNPTILSGDIGIVGNTTDNTYHVVISVNDNNNTILDGFTVRDINANGTVSVTIESQVIASVYASMYNFNSSPTITNCIFSNNFATNGGAGMYSEDSSPLITSCVFRDNSGNTSSNGGGMININSSPTITNCIFSNNFAAGGGAIYNGLGSPIFKNVVFTGNSATFDGGGMYNDNCSPDITNCVFSNNTSDAGGGILNRSSPAMIRNCIFSNNTTGSGGSGLYNDTSNATIVNCVFSKNTSGSDGIIVNLNANITIKNTIVWENVSPTAIINFFSSPTISYSNIQGNGASGTNIDSNPFFINSTDLDGVDNIWMTADDGLRLNCGSPCYNTGDNASPTLALDILGNAIFATTKDMGAYESQVALTTGTAPSTQVTALSFRNITTTAVQVEWNPGGGIRTLIVAKLGSTAASVAGLVNGTNYAADSNFAGVGASIDGGKVVFFGDGDIANITGLAANETYTFTIITANCNAYFTTNPVTGFITTTPNPTGIFITTNTVNSISGTFPATEAPARAIDNDRINNKYLNFTAANSGIEVITTTPSVANRLEIVCVSESGAEGRNPKTIRIEGKLTASGTYKQLTQQEIPLNATPNIAHFIEFYNIDLYDYYRITVVDVQAGGIMQVRELQLYNICQRPTIQATALSFRNITNTASASVQAEWNVGNGNRTLVIAKLGGTPASVAGLLNGTAITANANFAGASTTINGGKVVFFGTGDIANITGLAPETQYSFTIITANVCGTYQITNPVTGFITTTLAWAGAFTPTSVVQGFGGTIPATEGAIKAIDNDRTTGKYLNFTGANSGIEVITALSTINRIEIVCVSESGAETRNPKTIKIEGKVGCGGTYVTILNNYEIPANTGVDIPHFVEFGNVVQYNFYRITIVNTQGAGIMQVRELQLYSSTTLGAIPVAAIHVNGALTTGLDNGTSWANAYRGADALQKAIDNTNSICAQQIWVAKGTYKPTKNPSNGAVVANDRDNTFNLPNGIAIYGGFSGAGTETLLSERNIASNITILSGDFAGNDNISGSGATLSITNNGENAYHVVISINDDANTRLDGFTVSGGKTDTGAITIPVIGSVGRMNGGGMYNQNSSLTVINCVFSGNSSISNGGGMFNDSCSLTVINCIFRKNNANIGAGINNIFNSQIITNCIFVDNNAGTYAGGIHNAASSQNITNCTFFNNNAGTDGAGITNNAGAAPIIKNCIIWGNTGGGTQSIANFSSAAAVSYSIVQGGYAGTGNISANPLFVNATDPDGADNLWFTADDGLHLGCGSPSFNTGDNASPTPATDVLGNPRPIFTTADMGAYESDKNLTVVVATFTQIPPICSGDTFVLPTTSNNSYTGTWLPAINNTITTLYTFTPAAGQCSTTATMTVVVNPAATVLYVNGSLSTGANNGTSWANAFRGADALQKAIDIAGICAKQVWVAQGTYKPTKNPSNGAIVANDRNNTFNLPNDVAIYGGFSGLGTETALSQRNVTANPTILSGDLGVAGNADNAYHVIMTVDNNLITTLDGFTIKDANANGSSLITVEGYFIDEEQGGGMYNRRSSVMVNQCVFTSNNTQTGGSGMYNQSTSLQISNTIFSANNAGGQGGGMYNNSSDINMESCIFETNIANNGGGMNNGSSTTASIFNTIFHANIGDIAGGMYNDGDLIEITNCNFTNNVCVFTSGAGIYNRGGSQNIKNCIVWGNIGQEPAIERVSTFLTVTHSNVQGLSTYTGTNNINADPSFVDIADPNGADNIWRTADDGLALQCASPAINAGETAGAPTIDILGVATVGTKDIGAYERQTEGSFPASVLLATTTENNLILVPQCENAGWTYYAPAGSNNKWLIGINWAVDSTLSTLNNTAKNAAQVKITLAPALTSAENIPLKQGIWTTRRYWDVSIGANTLDEPVAVRYYFDVAEITAINTAASAFATANSVPFTPAKFFKTVGNAFNPATQVTFNSINSGNIVELTTNATPTGTHNGVSYVQLTAISSFSGGGAFAQVGVTPLPVELLSFSGKNKENANLLTWATTNEVNNKFFEIERSTNAIDFVKIGVVQANTNNESIKNYTFNDNNFSETTNYYRLKQVDNNGKTDYSKIIAIKSANNSVFSVNISPNPSKDSFVIDVNGNVSDKYSIVVYDMQGRSVVNTDVSGNKCVVSLGNCVSGVYFVKISSENSIITRKIVKN